MRLWKLLGPVRALGYGLVQLDGAVPSASLLLETRLERPVWYQSPVKIGDCYQLAVAVEHPGRRLIANWSLAIAKGNRQHLWRAVGHCTLFLRLFSVSTLGQNELAPLIGIITATLSPVKLSPRTRSLSIAITNVNAWMGVADWTLGCTNMAFRASAAARMPLRIPPYEGFVNRARSVFPGNDKSSARCDTSAVTQRQKRCQIDAPTGDSSALQQSASGSPLCSRCLADGACVRRRRSARHDFALRGPTLVS